jgi:sugar lactone lactonase YvrE
MPYGIAIDSKGFIYVTESEGHRVQKFTSDGVFVLQWGRYGTSAGQFMNPSGIAIDSKDNVYVGDYGRIQRFRSDSTYVGQWSGVVSDSSDVFANAIATDSYGHVYVPHYSYQWVSIFDTTGVFRYRWGSLGSGPGQFRGPTGIAIGPDGSIYVGDRDNYRVQKFAGGTVSVPSDFPDATLSLRVVGSPVRHGRIALRIGGAPSAEVTGGMYNLAGRQVAGIKGHINAMGELSVGWQVEDLNLSAGVYFVKVQQAGERAHAKFVVLR